MTGSQRETESAGCSVEVSVPEKDAQCVRGGGQGTVREKSAAKELRLGEWHLLAGCSATHFNKVTSAVPKPVGTLGIPWSFLTTALPEDSDSESLGMVARDLCF